MARPTPEKMLARAQEEERLQKQGKLKIYLGAAPGVGKTYSMLQDAQAKRDSGLDVVIGVVESHGRKEIEALSKGLDIIPPKKIDYFGRKIAEFDLDAALKRDPALILIDEMAHSNIAGARHAKRWQDIKEMLDRGIDVYTTLNVQHIESLNDIVTQITRIHIRETVPDSMLEFADTIELVDLSPDDLIKRLQEGKVYIPEQIEIAKQNFFRKGNLAALRELALRVTAERVDAQIMNYRQDFGIKHVWPARERILVCVGPGTQSPKMIRAARRMASRIQSEWIAVNIQTPKIELSEELRGKTIENLRLAEQLGAETQIIMGLDVVKEIINFARERNVTRIIIGKSVRARWKDLLFGSLVEELVRASGEIDIYIIHAEHIKEPKKKTVSLAPQRTPLKYYFYSLLIVGIATLFNFFIQPYVDSSNLIIFYLFSIVLIALFGRSGPSNFACLIATLTYDFLFAPIQFNFDANDFQAFITFISLLGSSLIISHLIIVSCRIKSAGLKENHSSALYALTRQLASSRGIDKILMIAARYISEAFDSEVMIFLHDNNQLIVRARFQSTQLLGAKEQSIAQWVYEMGQMAGLGTNTLTSSEALYVPLSGSRGSVGVLRVRPRNPERLLTPEKMHFLESCANQIALAVEVDRLHEQAQRSELKIETDQVRIALLQAVSHDLRTPVVSIMGSASTLAEMGNEVNTHQLNMLANHIYYESDQLNRLINNLLQVTYLEAESIKLQKEPASLKQLVLDVGKTLQHELGKKHLELSIPDNLPLIPFDKVLLEQVFENLIDNAIKFTPEDSPIKISAKIEKESILICIEDEGPGITPDEVDKLFEKFYRGRMLSSTRGLGLGLALCKTIIKAHGGNIWAENQAGSGASFRFTLPLQ